ncbi:Myosin heavy chain-related isoform 1 [Dorcoceras hygrometricum]|uniref:Myosin heavy chain-related isoform 1 n=1 Tax=Dorcoceras hygrometricum TaxID=472368 RepID=A0A2Z7D836_9LAMI|nr:Myosin heavy chain-related isoform 1 [Dorcoceras hygrometricum]
MSRFLSSRRLQNDSTQAPQPRYDDVVYNDRVSETLDNGEDGKSDVLKLRPSDSSTMGDRNPLVAVETHQKSSRLRDCTGDYINVRSRPYVMKLLEKQGDRKILFADKVLKFTCSGKMKYRVLLVTDFAIYIVDPDTYSLKRRVALAAVEKLCLSELTDNFFAIIIPTEYDLLMASTRKTEIAAVFVETTKSASEYELEVSRSNRFEYNAAAEIVKEVQFEEVEGGVRTRILRK